MSRARFLGQWTVSNVPLSSPDVYLLTMSIYLLPLEAFRVGREAGVPVVLSHHKVTGKAFWGTTTETLRRVEAARSVQPVAIDVYPCESVPVSSHDALLPPHDLIHAIR